MVGLGTGWLVLTVCAVGPGHNCRDAASQESSVACSRLGDAPDDLSLLQRADAEQRASLLSDDVLGGAAFGFREPQASPVQARGATDTAAAAKPVQRPLELMSISEWSEATGERNWIGDRTKWFGNLFAKSPLADAGDNILDATAAIATELKQRLKLLERRYCGAGRASCGDWPCAVSRSDGAQRHYGVYYRCGVVDFDTVDSQGAAWQTEGAAAWAIASGSPAPPVQVFHEAQRARVVAAMSTAGYECVRQSAASSSENATSTSSENIVEPATLFPSVVDAAFPGHADFTGWFEKVVTALQDLAHNEAATSIVDAIKPSADVVIEAVWNKSQEDAAFRSSVEQSLLSSRSMGASLATVKQRLASGRNAIQFSGASIMGSQEWRDGVFSGLKLGAAVLGSAWYQVLVAFEKLLELIVITAPESELHQIKSSGDLHLLYDTEMIMKSEYLVPALAGLSSSILISHHKKDGGVFQLRSPDQFLCNDLPRQDASSWCEETAEWHVVDPQKRLNNSDVGDHLCSALQAGRAKFEPKTANSEFFTNWAMLNQAVSMEKASGTWAPGGDEANATGLSRLTSWWGLGAPQRKFDKLLRHAHDWESNNDGDRFAQAWCGYFH